MSDDSRSESTHRSGSGDGRPSVPRAIIHKQILDRAAQDPDATMRAIADDISGVTVATVERVLEEYGDPCAEPRSSAEAAGSAATATDGGSMSESGRAGVDGIDRSAAETESGPETESEPDPGPETEAETESDDRTDGADSGDTDGDDADRASGPDDDPVPEPSSLTDAQRETLRAIADRPAATQAELAAELGVSGPTISQRVNSIDGFDWANRHEFVDRVFDSSDESTLETETDDGEDTGDENDDTDERSAADRRDDATADPDPHGDRRDVRERVAALERTVASLEDAVAAMRAPERSERTEQAGERTRNRERESDRDRDRNRRARDGIPERGSSVFDDPDLAHRIVHACVHSDRITEDEELRLLREITCGAAAPRGGES